MEYDEETKRLLFEKVSHSSLIRNNKLLPEEADDPCYCEWVIHWMTYNLNSSIKDYWWSQAAEKQGKATISRYQRRLAELILIGDYDEKDKEKS